LLVRPLADSSRAWRSCGVFLLRPKQLQGFLKVPNLAGDVGANAAGRFERR
jgi:hypothetical protein